MVILGKQKISEIKARDDPNMGYFYISYLCVIIPDAHGSGIQTCQDPVPNYWFNVSLTKHDAKKDTMQCVENALKLPWFCWMEIYRFDSLWSLSKFALIQTYKRVTWKNPIPNKDDKTKKRGRLVITLISSLRGCEQFKQKQKSNSS